MRLLHYWLIAVVVLLLAACIVGPESAASAESPLATWDPGTVEGFADATVGNGTLMISPNCVQFILENEKTVLLVWPEPTAWNAAAQLIEFVGVQGERVELRDGYQVMPGGATVVGEPQFVTPPDPSCEADEVFIVNSISIVTE